MQEQSNDPEFSRIIETAGLRPTGEEMDLEAIASELESVAKRLGLIGIYELKAQLKLEPWRKGGWHVTGALQAEIEQLCVVTAETFRSTCPIQIDRYFVHEKDRLNPSTAIVVDPLSDDEPDVLEGGRMDLGELAVEELALSLDPYPRIPGADFEPIRADASENADDEKPNPFAALAKLQRSD